MPSAAAIVLQPLDHGLHPALAQGLCGQAPAAQDVAHRVIADCFAARIKADRGRAWHGSSLTGDGFPLEFAVSAADPQLRFSCEPGAGSLAPAERLQLVSELAESLGETAIPADMLAPLRWAQQGAVLRYGGWLSARIGAQGGVATKLYAELAPDRPPPLLGEWLPPLLGREIQPRMLGIDGQGGCELYLRLPSLLPVELPAVLAPAGMADRGAEVLALLGESYGYPLRGRLPGCSVGVSYAPDSAGCTVTLYFFARALWGSDARIRQRFAPLIADRQQRQAYREATAPLAGHNGWATRHGLAGLILRPKSAPSWVVGFRPEAAS